MGGPRGVWGGSLRVGRGESGVVWVSQIHGWPAAYGWAEEGMGWWLKGELKVWMASSLWVSQECREHSSIELDL